MTFFYSPKFLKSYYYNNDDKIIRFDKFIMILQLVLTSIAVYLKYRMNMGVEHIVIKFIFLLFYIISIFYVICHYIRINKMNRNKSLSLGYLNYKFLTQFRIGFIIFIILNVGIIIWMLINNYKTTSESLWIWSAPLMTLAFIKGVFLDSIVMFGETYYYSGRYRVLYKSITHCEVIKETNTSLSKIYLVKLYNNDKLVGFDKFFMDDYFLLRKKIFY